MHLSALLSFLPLTVASPTSSPSELSKRQWTESKYCRTGTRPLCYLEIALRGTNPVFRVAVPDTANPPFDTILEITTPNTLAWTGFAWGGGMTLNPLTVVWPNGNAGKATVSSRWSSGRTMPGTYSSATYRTLSSSRNTTHWTVEVACTGCSKWSGAQLQPNDLNVFAWAVSRTAVSQPGSASSNFAIHNNVGMFTAPLISAKNSASAFAEYIRTASG